MDDQKNKVAQLMSLLGVETTKLILNEWEKNNKRLDQKLLISEMGKVNKIPVPIAKSILEEFFNSLNENETLVFTTAQELKKIGLTQKYISEQAEVDFALLDQIYENDLARFLNEIHPQMMSCLFGFLNPAKRLTVFQLLSLEKQTEIIQRLSKPIRLSSDVLIQLKNELEREFMGRNWQKIKPLSGSEEMGRVLAQLDPERQRQLLDEIKSKDPETANLIEQNLFTFDDLIEMDTKEFIEFFLKSDLKEWALALKIPHPGLEEKLKTSLPSRLYSLLNDERVFLSPQKKTDVLKMRQKILNMKNGDGKC
jgi:flagellar motor switch protein FliG